MTKNSSRPSNKQKRLRAHVDYKEMSVSYGRVKLGIPPDFKVVLENVTREILREQPKDIPAFLAAYFKHLDLNIRAGHNHSSLITERIVELKIIKNAATQESVEKPETVEAGTECFEANKDKPYNADDECSIAEIDRDDIVGQDDSNIMSLEQAEANQRKSDVAIIDNEDEIENEEESTEITQDQKNAMDILNHHEAEQNLEQEPRTTLLPDSNLVLVNADTIVQDSIMVLLKESEQVINDLLDNPTDDVRTAFSDIENAIRMQECENCENNCNNEQDCEQNENQEANDNNKEETTEKIDINNDQEKNEEPSPENEETTQENEESNPENEETAQENEEPAKGNDAEQNNESEQNLNQESSENIKGNDDELNIEENKASSVSLDEPTNKMDIIEKTGDVNESEQIC